MSHGFTFRTVATRCFSIFSWFSPYFPGTSPDFPTWFTSRYLLHLNSRTNADPQLIRPALVKHKVTYSDARYQEDFRHSNLEWERPVLIVGVVQLWAWQCDCFSIVVTQRSSFHPAGSFRWFIWLSFLLRTLSWIWTWKKTRLVEVGKAQTPKTING